MKLITINKKQYNIPQSWNELTGKQLLQVMNCFLKSQSAEKLVLKLLQVLTDMNHYQFARCDVADLSEFFYLLVFLFQEKIDLTKNLLPVYKRKGEDPFYGPADELANLRMKEFSFTEELFIRWFDSGKKDDQALNELVAILYRPAPADYDIIRNPAGDKREPFNEHTFVYTANKHISRWPLHVKHAIAAWYDGSRRKVVENNPDVFSGGGDPARYGLVSVMLNIAEGGVFGDFERVEHQYVNLVMMQLNEVVDQSKRIEKQNKS